MDEDAIGPPFEAVGLSQVRELAPDGDEGVLQDILGEVRVAEDPPGDPEQRVADLVHQIRERLLVAGAGSLHEVSVHRSLWRPRHGTAVYQA